MTNLERAFMGAAWMECILLEKQQSVFEVETLWQMWPYPCISNREESLSKGVETLK